MIMLRTACLLVMITQLSGAFGPASAKASQRAIIPSVLHDGTERREHEVYDKIPDMHGTYAHGVAGDRLFENPESLGKFCQGTDKDRQRIIARFGATLEEEFWYFGTKSQGVVFIKSTKIQSGSNSTTNCSELIDVSLNIYSGYAADKFIHNFVFDPIDRPAVGSFDKRRTDRQYADLFITAQTLMARSTLPRPGWRGKIRHNVIAGIPVDCGGRSAGGLVWATTCYASTGNLRGMLLLSQSGDDERTLSHYEVTEIRDNALLPGVVFEVDRAWSLAD